LLIACKEYESEFIQQVRQGNTHLLLPETREQFHDMCNSIVKKMNLPKFVLEIAFRERLLHLDTQKKCK